jgi:hypothetical protein
VYTFNFFNVDPNSLNLFSIVLGMFFGATMWRYRALIYVVVYFMALAAFYGTMYYINKPV